MNETALLASQGSESWSIDDLQEVEVTNHDIPKPVPPTERELVTPWPPGENEIEEINE
jgi:hypothetical protein